MSTQNVGDNALKAVQDYLDTIQNTTNDTERVGKRGHLRRWVNNCKPVNDADIWEPMYHKDGNDYYFGRKGENGGYIEPVLKVNPVTQTAKVWLNNTYTDIDAIESSTLAYHQTEATHPLRIPAYYLYINNDISWSQREEAGRIQLDLAPLYWGIFGKSALDSNTKASDLCYRYVTPRKVYYGRCKDVGHDGKPTARPLICEDFSQIPVPLKIVYINERGKEVEEDLRKMPYDEFIIQYKKIIKESTKQKLGNFFTHCRNKYVDIFNARGKKGEWWSKFLGFIALPFTAMYEGVKSGIRSIKEMNDNLVGRKDEKQIDDAESDDMKNAKNKYNDAVRQYNEILDKKYCLVGPRILRSEEMKQAKKKLKEAKEELKKATNKPAIMNTNTANQTIDNTNAQTTP